MSALRDISAYKDTVHLQAHFVVVARLLWEWIEANGDRKVSLKFWIIRKSFTIRELEPVFALLIGPKPSQAFSL